MFSFDTGDIITAAATFLRISCIIALLPLFGESNVPVRVRILLSVALTAGIYPLLPASYESAVVLAIQDIGTLSLVMAKEMLIGITLGYTAKLAFDGIVMAASMVGIQMGFNTASVFMPDSEEQTNGFSALHRLLIILIFLALNMHHIYIKSIWDSFQLIPIGHALPSGGLNILLLKISSGIFTTAVQLAAPILVGLLFATCALGLINRAVPQANVFVMSFPANFFVGLFLYMALLPLFPGWLQNYFESSQRQIMTALALLAHSWRFQAMADNETDKEDKTEEASAERREEFREQGNVAMSNELSQVAGLAAIAMFITWYMPQVLHRSQKILIQNFQAVQSFRVSDKNLISYLTATWVELLYIILPFFIVAAAAGTIVTLLQTQFNWSWKKLEADWSKLNPLPGMARLFSKESVVGLIKSCAKMAAVAVIAWLVLAGEWRQLPALLNANFAGSWLYFADITRQLLWGVVGLMVFIGAADFIYIFLSLETKMKMTIQEVKEETKQRETDPHVKAKLRRMARDIATRKTVENTKKATVLVTNPTHYSIAIRYEVGMPAPLVVAKGVDFVALKMRETAKELEIPIIENKALARAIYAAVKDGDEIPVSMYQAVSEIIKFVFQLKGIKVTRKTADDTQPKM